VSSVYTLVQGDPADRTRREDDLIAWTWRRFLDDPSDPEILLQLPMTKVILLQRNKLTACGIGEID